IAYAPVLPRAKSRLHRAADDTGAGRSARSFVPVHFLSHFLPVPRAQNAAPQTRLHDAYPVIPPTPLFPPRQCLRCAPASAPVFQAREKPAEIIHSATPVGAPALPSNLFLR